MHFIYSAVAVILSTSSTVLAQLQDCHAVQASGELSTLCGIRGTLRRQYWAIAAPAVVSSLEECASVCESRRVNKKLGQSNPTDYNVNHYCQSFYFDSETNLCGIGGGDFRNSVQANQSSTQVFYSYRCFTCEASFCSQAIGQELLYNGDFEKEPIGPWKHLASRIPSNGTIGPGYQSKSSWQITTRGFFNQAFNSCPDFLYKLSFDYKITPDGPDTNVVFQNFMEEQNYLFQTYTGDGKWKSITGFFTKESFIRFNAGDPRPSAPKKGINKYNVDNVKVSRFPFDPSTKALAQPAFQNGGFESGDIAPWTLGDPTPKHSIISPGLSGSQNALVVDLTKFPSFRLSNTIEVKQDTNYMVSFNYDLIPKPAVSEPTGYMALEYSDGIRFINLGSRFNFTLDYGKGTFSFPIGVPSAQMGFAFEFKLLDCYNITLDNFGLEEIIE